MGLSTGPLTLFLPSLAGGGAERVMLNLAAGFTARGYPVDLVLAKAVGEYLDQVPPGVRVVDLGTSRPLTAVPALARYLRAKKPQALLSSMTHANLAALWAKRMAGVPTRCVVREASTLSVELVRASFHNRWLIPSLVRREYQKAHAVVAVSKGVAADLNRVTGLSAQQIQVIYNPIVSSQLLQRSRLPVNHPWFKEEIPIILGIGRLTEQKDFWTLIKAFAQLRQRRPARLIVLGEGEARRDLEQLCQALEVTADVEMPGFVANPYAFLSKAALFVLSSRWEGLPGVLIEALACGAKVVATDCPSGPREILDGGVYGQLVPVGDFMAMAKAMEKALSGEFVAADPKKWLSLFESETNTDRFLSLLVE